MKKIYLIAAVIFMTRPSIALYAADSTPTILALSSGSQVYLTGNSTLHPYASTSTLTQVVAVLALGNDAEATAPVAEVLTDIAHRAPFQKFEVTIPVKGLKSGESGLDKNLYKALKSDQAPEIRFTLTHYEASPTAADGSIPLSGGGTTVHRRSHQGYHPQRHRASGVPRARHGRCLQPENVRLRDQTADAVDGSHQGGRPGAHPFSSAVRTQSHS